MTCTIRQYVDNKAAREHAMRCYGHRSTENLKEAMAELEKMGRECVKKIEAGHLGDAYGYHLEKGRFVTSHRVPSSLNAQRRLWAQMAYVISTR